MMRSRLRFLTRLFTFIAVVSLLTNVGTYSAVAQVETETVAKPNVVVILADDFPYERFTPFTGYKEGLMPRVNSICERGISFPQGYVSGPVCAPTRGGLMTGRYQARYGYETFTGSIRRQIGQDVGVNVDEILLPELMQQAGYRTSVIGKWHLGYNPHFHPNRRGVDHFFGFQAGGHDYMIWSQTQPGFEGRRGGGPILRNEEEIDGEGYLTEAFTAEGAQFIRENAAQEEPFFLYFAPFNVHSPFEVPERYLQEGDDVMDGMIRALDVAVGTLLDALEEAGVQENTLLVFINDNGGVGKTNAPYREGKNTVYEGGVRVPFAMMWPGHYPEGVEYDHPVIQLDILPTVVAAAGGTLPTDRPLDGVDLTPYLTGEINQDTRPHEVLYWRSAPSRQCAIRLGDLKLLNPGRGKSPQLFDLSVDPGERNNLISSRPEDAARLHAAYQAWHNEVNPPVNPEFQMVIPE